MTPRAKGSLAVLLAVTCAVGGEEVHAQRRGETMKVTAADERKATVTPTDEGFVRNASGAYQFGSRLAMLAATRGEGAAGKRFGETLVKDFIELGERLKPAASGEKGYQWAHEPQPADEKTLAALERLSGRELDDALKPQFVALLQRLDAVFQAEAEKGRDPDLKPLSRDAATWVKKRLAEAKALPGGA